MRVLRFLVPVFPVTDDDLDICLLRTVPTLNIFGVRFSAWMVGPNWYEKMYNSPYSIDKTVPLN